MRKINFILFCIFFSCFSNASSLQRDKIIINNDILSFGSLLTYEFYDLLTNTDFYTGYTAASSGFFNDSKNSYAIIAPNTGCSSRTHDALWKIENNKIYILDLKSCGYDFLSISTNKQMIFASWVSGEFYVQSKNITKKVRCIGNNGKFLAINQEYYFLKIIGGEVVKLQTVLRNVEGNSHAYGAFFEECEPLVRR